MPCMAAACSRGPYHVGELAGSGIQAQPRGWARFWARANAVKSRGWALRLRRRRPAKRRQASAATSADQPQRLHRLKTIYQPSTEPPTTAIHSWPPDQQTGSWLIYRTAGVESQDPKAGDISNFTTCGLADAWTPTFTLKHLQTWRPGRSTTSDFGSSRRNSNLKPAAIGPHY